MVGAHVFDTPPPGCAEDWTMAQNWSAFTQREHQVWDQLVEKQSRTLGARASRAFLDGLDILRTTQPGIPDYQALNSRLMARTRWQIVPVPGFIPNHAFFTHLANKRFPVANFLRSPENIDYSEEPDMFHDLFGHVPILTNPIFSDFLVAYGEAGLRAERLGASGYLGRLWLYTVEFGLVVEDGALRAYGGGLLSSAAETVSALTSPGVRRVMLNIPRAMRTRYHFDRFQEIYFVIDSFSALLRLMEETDFSSVYAEIGRLDEIAASDGVEEDIPYRLAHDITGAARLDTISGTP